MKVQTILSITSIFNNVKDSQLPLNISFKIIKLLEQLEKGAQVFQTNFSLLMSEYGEVDEKGELVILEDGGYKIKEDSVEICNAKLNEMLNAELDIDIISFTLEELELLNLTFEQLRMLYQANLIKE